MGEDKTVLHGKVENLEDEEFKHRIHSIRARPSLDDIPPLERRMVDVEKRLKALEREHDRGIPVLPLREDPESGYRAIRDELTTLYGDKLDPEKSYSVQVIELLRAHASCGKPEEDDWEISCSCGWRGWASERASVHSRVGEQDVIDYLCPSCGREDGREMLNNG